MRTANSQRADSPAIALASTAGRVHTIGSPTRHYTHNYIHSEARPTSRIRSNRR